MSFVCENTSLPGVKLIKPSVFGDQRGFFQELYHCDRYREHGIDGVFVQDNWSRSAAGVLRGLHYQLQKPQAKLVSVIRGAVFDVAVDLRRGSPTFGQWHGCMLTEENHHQFYIPEGFAHGFCVTEGPVDFMYKCSNLYDPADDRGIRWNDPAIGIDWPLENPVVSEKDKALPVLEDQLQENLPVYGE